MRAEIKRALTSPLFWGMAAVLLLCFQGYAGPCFWADRTYIDDPAARQSALHLTLGSIFFGGFQLMIPFCAALCYGGTVVEDVRTGILHYMLLRSSVTRYAAYKMTAAFVCGAVMALCAFLLHAVFWHALALPYDPVRYPDQEIGFWKQSFFSQWQHIANAWAIILWIALGMAFSAGIWAIVAVAVAIWVPDRVLVGVIPACLYKLWNMQFAFYLFGVRVQGPDTLFNDAQTWARDGECLVLYATVLLLAVAVFYGGVRRRSVHG